MRISKEHFNSILMELIDENAIACRGILRVSDVVFTTTVPTMAITLTGKPKLCVNLEFVEKYCETEAHVKAVLVHEFLHVLLNHAEKFNRMTPSLNLALDAVINAIIHRTFGEKYSGMMSAYYGKSRGNVRLLRPMSGVEEKAGSAQPKQEKFFDIWLSLYQGRLVADDLFEIAAIIGDPDEAEPALGDGTFLGNHDERPDDPDDEVSTEVEAILHETMTSVTGGGIWRSPREHGVGLNYAKLSSSPQDKAMRLWEKEAVKVLSACVTPDKNTFVREEHTMSLPILNESDKRGFLRSTWTAFLPDIVWTTGKNVQRGTTQIYLDVSGSMNKEMDALVSLIWRLRRHIRLPFWAFSNIVEPAEIRNGKLITSTTGGTSMNAVLKHVAATRPGKAVVITDGYIEKCDPNLLSAIGGQDVRAIVSRRGSPAELERAGIPYAQLGRFAYDSNS